MTTGEIVTVYRNLACQKWTTLPDEQWMHGLTLAVEKRLAKQEASAQRAELQKQASRAPHSSSARPPRPRPRRPL